MGGRKDGREDAIPLGSGKGQRKAGIRKLREDIEVALGDQHCFSLSSGCGASLRSENIPHRVSLYSKDTHTQSWSEFRKNSLFSFQTDATGGSLNLCLFVLETETREGQQCAHGLETSSLLILGRASSVPTALRPAHSLSTGKIVLEITSSFWLCGL